MNIHESYLTAVKQAHPRDRIQLIVQWRDSVTIEAHARHYSCRSDLHNLNDQLYKLIGDCVHALEFCGSPSAGRAVQERLREIEQLPILKEE